MKTDLAVKAFAHPTRPRIIEALIACDEPMSPKGLSDLLDEPLGNVSYHVRTLHAAGILKLARKVPRRGAIEHFYRLDDRKRERLADQLVALAGSMRNGGGDV